MDIDSAVNRCVKQIREQNLTPHNVINQAWDDLHFSEDDLERLAKNGFYQRVNNILHPVAGYVEFEQATQPTKQQKTGT